MSSHCSGSTAARLWLALAAAKDSGFTTPTFVESLRAITRLRPQDWVDAGIEPAHAERVREMILAWRQRLTS